MVGELYDYIVSIIVVGIIFASGVLAVPAISYLNLRHVDEQQLRNTALNVFESMLLGAGSPPRWGSVYPFEQDAVESFGLSDASQSSLFVLDSDKVQRLDPESPGCMTYEKVKELLNLNGYGFSLTMFRPFDVRWNLEIFPKEERVWFSVNVSRNEDGRPIPNAQIVCTIMVTASNYQHLAEPIVDIAAPKTYFTNVLGNVEANELVPVPENYELEEALAILKITVAGMSTMVVARSQQDVLQEYIKVYSFGDTIILKVRDEAAEDIPGERRVYGIHSYTYDELITIFNGADFNPPDLHITQGLGYETWECTFPGLEATNPLLLLFTLRVKNPDRLVIIAGPFSFWESSKLFTFGADSVSALTTAVTLRRFVVLSEMTYDAELTLWKEGL